MTETARDYFSFIHSCLPPKESSTLSCTASIISWVTVVCHLLKNNYVECVMYTQKGSRTQCPAAGV